MTAVWETQAVTKINREWNFLGESVLCFNGIVSHVLCFTFHLRLAYCLLKFSKLTTDSLFTMACLGFRGCRERTRDAVQLVSPCSCQICQVHKHHSNDVIVTIWSNRKSRVNSRQTIEDVGNGKLDKIYFIVSFRACTKFWKCLFVHSLEAKPKGVRCLYPLIR